MADVPKIVIGRLTSGRAQAATTEPHPDANLLAAFVERALGSAERLQVLGHLAECSRCREIVALAVPELPAAKADSHLVSAPWLSWPVLRWGAAVACVVVVGAAVTLRHRELRQAVPGGGSPSAVSEPAVLGPQREAMQSPGLSMATGVEVTRKATNHVPSERSSARAANEAVVPGRAKDGLGTAQPSSSGPMMAGGMAIPWTATPSIGPSLKTKAMPVPRWALTADGTLQRSFDMGLSWEPITVSLEASLRALAANGLDIWVGGTAGALYHSEDAGEHWVKVQPISDGRPLTADIIGVEFTDFEHGRLNTASGEVWTTEDAGLTWQEQ